MATILSATALDLRTLKVVFSEAVDTTALVASNWAVACTGSAPFATPLVTATEGADSDTTPTVVVLKLGFEMSPEKPYTITGTGITGVAAPNNVATFNAPTLPTVAGRNFQFINWIPDLNLREDITEDLRKFVSCMDDQLKIHINDVDRWEDCQDPDLASSRFVEQMLKDFGNPFDASLTLEKQRRLVKLLIPIYKKIGTIAGLRDVIWWFLHFEIEVTIAHRQGMRLGQSLLGLDWVLGCGPNKYYYLVKVATPNGRAFTDSEKLLVEKIVDTMKYAHEVAKVQEALPAPTGLVATGPVGGGIVLSWDPVDGADSYMIVMRSTPEVSIWNGQRIIATTTSKTLPVPAGQHRYFRVMAKNARGEGLLSTEVDVVAG